MADDLSWPARHTTFSAASVSLPRQRLQCKAVQENTLLAHPELQEHQEKALPFRAAQMAILEDPDAPQAQDVDLNGVQSQTFTITNVGQLGGTGVFPTINYPEVAILGMGRMQERPVVRQGEIDLKRLRWPVALTFAGSVAGTVAVQYLGSAALERVIPILLIGFALFPRRGSPGAKGLGAVFACQPVMDDGCRDLPGATLRRVDERQGGFMRKGGYPRLVELGAGAIAFGVVMPWRSNGA